MQPSGYLVGVGVEFSAGVKLGHDDLGGGAFQFIVALDAGRYAAAVVLDGDGIIGMDDDAYLVAMSCQRFVNGVIQHFEYHVMQAGAIAGIADIHAGPFAHRVKPFQDLDALGAIISRGFRFFLSGTFFLIHKIDDFSFT